MSATCGWFVLAAMAFIGISLEGIGSTLKKIADKKAKTNDTPESVIAKNKENRA